MGGQFDLTLTDIPYGEANRSSNGLRNLDKEDADILTFNLQDFLKEIYEVTKKYNHNILWERADVGNS